MDNIFLIFSFFVLGLLFGLVIPTLIIIIDEINYRKRWKKNE